MPLVKRRSGNQRGTRTHSQLVTKNAAGAPTLTGMGASYDIATGAVLTLFIAAQPNGSSVCGRVVDEVFGAVFEQEKVTADLPANTQFLSPRLFVNSGATVAALRTARGPMWKQITGPFIGRMLPGKASGGKQRLVFVVATPIASHGENTMIKDSE